MSKWQVKKIKDLCEIGRGRVISQEEIEKNLGIYPVYSSQSSNKGEMGKIDTYDFEGEYVTWTTDGAYAGTVFYRNGKFNCTNVCGTLKAKDENLSTEFLAYLLSTIAKRHVSYVGNPKLMNNVMAQIELSLPIEEKEQSKIAAVLGSIDKAIEQTEKLIEKQKRIKRGLLHDLLTKGIDENGAIRSEATHEFKDSPLGRIPEDWNVCKIEEIANLKSGGTPDRRNEEFWNGAVNWVKTSEINYNFIFYTEEKITERGLNNSSATLFPPNTVLIAIYGEGNTRGRVAILKIYAATNQACIAFLLKSKDIITEFLYFYLSYSYDNLRNLSNDGSQKNLSKLLLDNFLIKLPHKTEQERIAQTLKVCDEKIQNEIYYLAKLNAKKRGLMQDLLTENAESRISNLL